MAFYISMTKIDLLILKNQKLLNGVKEMATTPSSIKFLSIYYNKSWSVSKVYEIKMIILLIIFKNIKWVSQHKKKIIIMN